MARIAYAVSLALMIPGVLVAFARADESAPRMRSTLDDQRSLAITIYNQNLGLVKDRRSIELPKGVLSLSFMDVAEKIDPTSVHIRSLTEPEALAVHEQNYEYDLLSPAKLLEKYVGKEVRLIEINPETGAETETPATILSTHDGLVYRTADGITFDPGRAGSEHRRWFFPGLPENLISEPTLVWRLESGRRGRQSVEASYLTSGIDWKADYVGLLNEDDTRMDLTGWVTIDNQSGATYRNATLQLVAGDIHRAERRHAAARRGRVDRMEMAASAPKFEEQAFFEYHLYTLDRKTTIRQRQTKQMTLFDAPGVAVEKEFVYRGGGNFWSRWVEPARGKVGVYLKFQNDKASGMGLPLPLGVVRIYKEDTRGSVQFLGEDRIDHTPVDEEVELKIGEAFDVVAERKQTDFRKIAEKVTESAYEITIRNHKKTGVVVSVIERIPGDWEILQKSHDFEKEKSNQVRFRVPVGAGGEAKVTYRVRIR